MVVCTCPLIPMKILSLNIVVDTITCTPCATTINSTWHMYHHNVFTVVPVAKHTCCHKILPNLGADAARYIIYRYLLTHHYDECGVLCASACVHGFFEYGIGHITELWSESWRVSMQFMPYSVSFHHVYEVMGKYQVFVAENSRQHDLWLLTCS